jgi:hypothetical protein
MATKFARSDDFKGSTSRVSFAQNLFKAREQGKPPNVRRKFGCTLIMPKADLRAKCCRMADGTMKTWEEIVGAVIVETWGEKGLERAAKGLIKSPFLTGDGKEARNKETGELHPGMGPDVFFIRVQANEDRPPKVFASATATIPATQEDVYSGCYGFAVLNAFAWHNDENGDGVSFGINMFFKKADGEKIGGSGGSDPEKWAETVEDAGGAPAETKTGAGAGGLFGAMD